MKIIFDNEVNAETISFQVSNKLAKKVIDFIWQEMNMNIIKSIGKKSK